MNELLYWVFTPVYTNGIIGAIVLRTDKEPKLDDNPALKLLRTAKPQADG